MSNVEFYTLKFHLSETQKQLVEEIKKVRSSYQVEMMYIKSLERTKQFTRTVYPTAVKSM